MQARKATFHTKLLDLILEKIPRGCKAFHQQLIQHWMYFYIRSIFYKHPNKSSCRISSKRKDIQQEVMTSFAKCVKTTPR